MKTTMICLQVDVVFFLDSVFFTYKYHPVLVEGSYTITSACTLKLDIGILQYKIGKPPFKIQNSLYATLQ